MPFVSEAQRRYLWMAHPEIARKWAAEFPGQHDLPEHVGKKKVIDAMMIRQPKEQR